MSQQSVRYFVKRGKKAIRIFDRASTFYAMYTSRDWPDMDVAEAHAHKQCAEWNAGTIDPTGAAHE